MTKWFVTLAVFAGFILTACDPGNPKLKDGNDLTGLSAQVNQAEFNNLTPLQRYQVANKIMATFFKGIAAKDFFTPDSIMEGDASKLVLSDKGTSFLSVARKGLGKSVENRDEIYTSVVGDPDNEIEGKYAFDESEFALQFPLAFMYELDLSDEFYARWMAYKLTNTILFSPAEEIDSADDRDVQKIYGNLVQSIMDGASIRSIILAHQKSEGNWRRFRSPEDNTREMIEIYLGLFDRDADVPKASIACRNWYLTDQDEGYQLIKGDNINTEPQWVLDTAWVKTCDDFYEVVANHPLVIPRITTVLVDHMLGVDYPAERRTQLVNEIASTFPERFDQIFTAIIFSQEYLLNMTRPKWFEESTMNVAGKVYWKPHNNYFRGLNRNGLPSAGVNANLASAYQPSFRLKLGRWPVVPQNVLSASYMHKGLRDIVMKRNSFENDWGWGDLFTEDMDQVSTSVFINYIFMSVVARTPTADEMTTLTGVIDSNDATNLTDGKHTTAKTLVILDYLSRLPELYYFNAIN